MGDERKEEIEVEGGCRGVGGADKQEQWSPLWSVISARCS